MKNFLYILALVLITVSASLFMVFESASYFQTYYGIGSWKPFYLAAIMEVFLIALSIIKYGETWFKRTQNAIMISIFLTIVVSSGLGSVHHVFQAMDQYEKEQKIEEVRKQKLASLEQDNEYFRQKARSEVTVDRYAMTKNQAYDQYIRSLEESGKSNSEAKLALINIILLILVRFLVQSANLICARSIGVVYRGTYIEHAKEKLVCERNKETKMYEIKNGTKVVAYATTARAAWKKIKSEEKTK